MSLVQENASEQANRDEVRKLWIEAVELMAQNEELKRRVEFLEREIAINAFGGWQRH